MTKKTIRSLTVRHGVIVSLLSLAIVAVSVCGLLGLVDIPSAIFLIAVALLFIVLIFAVIVYEIKIRSILKAFARLTEQVGCIANGRRAFYTDYKNYAELARLSGVINNFIDYLIERLDLLVKINDGDYTEYLPTVGESDVLSEFINNIIRTNNDIIGEIRTYSFQISTAAGEIASGSQELANGSSQQAAAIEQLSAVISNVRKMSEDNTEISQLTLNETKESGKVMDKNVSDMKVMTDTMEDITVSSKRIETVIKVIDDIAFQTNILALNAAVEAARAGQHGKGFAVVADEVRELASKAAAAANETSELIKASINSVGRGNDFIRTTNENISRMSEISMRTAENMDRLTASSQKQSKAIAEINNGIGQIAGVVQANSAMAEQSSAAAQTLSIQSEYLNSVIDKYRLAPQETSDAAGEKKGS